MTDETADSETPNREYEPYWDTDDETPNPGADVIHHFEYCLELFDATGGEIPAQKVELTDDGMYTVEIRVPAPGTDVWDALLRSANEGQTLHETLQDIAQERQQGLMGGDDVLSINTDDIEAEDEDDDE